MKRTTRLLAMVIACVALASCAKVENRMTVTNKSGDTVRKATVTVCGVAYDFTDIPDGDAKTQKFSVKHDSSFQVDALLADGTTLTTNFGYVTGGAGAYGNHADIEIAGDRRIVGKQK